MYTVIALYDDAEIAIGVGDTYEGAAAEAAEQVPDVYPAGDVLLVCEHGSLTVSTPLDLWLWAR